MTGYSAEADPGRPEAQPANHDAERVAERAHLLPEELAAGSADPDQQAAAILAESDDRTEHPERTQEESSQTLESN